MSQSAEPRYRVLERETSSDKMGLREALERFAHAVVVSKAEHERLNRYLRETMPGGWDRMHPSADPLERYHAVNITVDRPLGR